VTPESLSTNIRPLGQLDESFVIAAPPETVWAARDSGPIASPQAKASDHVLARFSRGL